jgi:rRNA maturation endonuclease Nob1
MGVLSAVSILEIKARGSIKDADVLKLRRSYYDDGCISEEEADTIFSLNEACPVQDPAWADCFVETITDYIVNQAVPEGYVTAANAQWLIERISRDGRVQTKTELELLVNVLDKARWAPQSLARFALDQVKSAVINGDGPLRAGKTLTPGVVTEAEVDLLRRIIYSFASDGNIAVSQPEAEALFAIDRATADADNHPSWRDLFVKAIANCVMAASGHAAPPREVALARDAWLDRRGELSIDNLASGMVSGFKGLFSAYREQSAEERAIQRLTQQKIEIVTNEAITPLEASWLAGQIGREGKLTPNERALLMFIKLESPSIDPGLHELIDKAAAAA